MDTMNLLVKLQENYDIMKECNRILKDGSHIYLLKKLKGDFEKGKALYMEKDSKLKELKEKFIMLSTVIQNERKELENNELELQALDGTSYKALSHLQNKIEFNKTRLKQLEDESVRLLEEEDKVSFEKENLRLQLINLKENFYKYKENINSEIRKAQDEMNKARETAEKLKGLLSKEVVFKFEKLIDKKIIAVGKLEGGMCSSCRMKVSALTIDNIYKGTEIVNCNNCGRFLYYSLQDLKLAK